MCDKTPFPQANDLNKIMLYVYHFEYKTTSNLMNEINVTSPRQLSYYRDAAIFLGFIANVNGKYRITKKGININPGNEFYKEVFIFELLSIPLINNAFKRQNELLSILNEEPNFKKLSISTKRRRVSCFESWLKWLNEELKNNE